MDHYYFAYGSCMDKNDFHRSMGKTSYEEVGIAKLDEYKLEFNGFSSGRNGGVLDVEESEFDHVIGVLYRVSDEALIKVDVREGTMYMRIMVMVECNGAMVKAYTYTIKEKKKTKASREYSILVYKTMKQRAFPEDYIEQYVKLTRISLYGSEMAYYKHCYKKEQKEGVKWTR